MLNPRHVGQQHRCAADVAYALEATIVRGVGLPPGDASDIKVTILRVKAALLRAGQEIRDQALRRTLPTSGDLFTADD